MEKVSNEIKVSVIVPVYNIEKYIERCLLSLVNQTLQEIEILCIDDGSTDGSALILDELQEQYPDKIKVSHIPNGGVSNARNLALQLAQGEFIGFVDGDDFVRRDMFEELYNKAVEDNSDIVSSSYISMFEKKSYIIHADDMQYYGKSVYECPELLTCDVSFLWNKIFRRSMLEENNLHFEKFKVFEDMLFVDQAFLVANRISKVNTPFYYYRRIRTGSATNTFSVNLFDLFEALELLYDFYKKHNAFEKFNDMLLFITLNHSFIRFRTVIPYQEELINLKLRFLDTAFKFFNKHFPDWQKNEYFYSVRNVYMENYISKEYWTDYIKYAAVSDLPDEFRDKADEIKKRTAGTADTKKSEEPDKPNSREKKIKFLSDYELGVLYKKYCKKGINKKAILIDSQHGDNLSGNMFYLLKQLFSDSKYSRLKVYLVYRGEKLSSFKEKLNFYNLNPVLVDNRSKDYVKALATSKYLFNDTSFPIFFNKRSEQIYLNTWHGTALKTLGVSSKGEIYRLGNLQRNFCSADYVLCPNEHMKNVFDNDYYLSTLGNASYMFAGYPRNSVFFEKPNQRIVEENDLHNKQVIMYMPTWRGSIENIEDDDLYKYLFEIDSKLDDNQVMYVNLHPYVADLIDYSCFKHIKSVSSKYETYDFLNCCDVLITDYSSVFFDFAVSGKKIILFTYDREDYLADRGMYFPLSYFPFCSVETTDDLVSAIRDDNKQDTSEFINEFCLYDNADVSQEILDYIIFGQPFSSNCFVEDNSSNGKKNVLVFAGNLYNNLHTDNLYKAITGADKNCSYTLTFLSKYLRANYSVLNAFQQGIKSYSVLGRISYLKPSDDKKLTRALDDFNYFDKHRNKFWSFIRKEYDRLYGHIRADRIVCFGGKSAIVLAILSSAPCEKILYVPSKGTFNENLCHNVYKNFEKIYYKQDAVGKAIKAAGNKNVEKITDIKDIFR